MTGTDADLEPRIAASLAARLAGGADVTLHDVQRIAVGWSHETWLFDATWHAGGAEVTPRAVACAATPATRCCARCPTSGRSSASSSASTGTGVPAPQPYYFEDDPAVLGAPFLVMEKVPGTCPSPWGRDGLALLRRGRGRGVLPGSFTDALIAVHTLDWEAAGLGFLGVPAPGTDFARREIATWRALIDASGVDVDPVLTDVLCWLEAQRPVRPTASRSSTAPTARATS